MKKRYVVLRDLSDNASVRAASRSNQAASDAGLWAVQSVTADAGEARDLGRERDVRAVAAAMPMQLIRPFRASARHASGSTPVESTPIAWGITAVGADDRCPFDGRSIKVAVLDTGIDPSHPAFDGVRMERRNFTDDVDEDTEGHGTHCAGTIFGRTVQGTRIGVATGVTDVLIGKVLGARGCDSEQIADAVLWAVENGARVVSMSLGMDFPGHVRGLVEGRRMSIEMATSLALEDYRANVLLFERLASMIRARSARCLIIAAAGNESRRELDPSFVIGVSPPAVSEGIVSVAAIGPGPDGWRPADFSNVGANLCAPGVDIVSAALGGGLAALSGTSMAAPHVAGVAALWAQRGKDLGEPPGAFAARLEGNASTRDLAPGWTAASAGAGIVRAPPSP